MTLGEKGSGLSDAGAVAVAPLLPWPDAWGRARPRPVMVAAVVFFGVVFLVFVPFTVDAVRSGNGVRVLYGVVAALAAATFVAMALPQLRVRRPQLPRDFGGGGSGLRLSLGRYRRLILAAWFVAGIAFLVVRVVLVAGHLFAFDYDGRTGRIALDVVQLVVALAAIGVLGFLVMLTVGGRRANYVELGTVGVVRVAGAITKSVAWEDIAGASPLVVNEVAVVRIVPVSEAAVRIDIGDGRGRRWRRLQVRPQMELPAAVFGVDPALLLYLVDFYGRHPEARHELVSDGVVDRVRRGDLLG
ncbi:hypothetical protein [Nocardia sp. NPDC020380]|uniref:hypothetical protein n=1 Tax=Nocardia sp. NPDC020380 TaxID=3364309 RepID=UPI00378C4586